MKVASIVIWLFGMIALFSASFPALAADDKNTAFSQAELDQMMAPVALYPDSLLSQILMASTYPDQVKEAAAWSKKNPKEQGDAAVKAVQDKAWDPSVASLAAFPQVLAMMGNKPDWVKNMGDAFLAEPKTVMETVQKLRKKAKDAGNLKSTEQEKVTTEGQTIIIQPANPQVVYVPAIAVWPGKVKAGVKNHDILGGLDLMATFASVAGVKLPEKDRDGKPIIFDSYDMSPVLFGKGKSARKAWFYFTENELTPGAARVGNYKAVFNLRGDDGQATGGLAVDSNLGWKGAEKYVATVPQVFDLWQDPQERYDLFMNNYTERTWTLVTINQAVQELMKTYIKYPPRKLQSEVYTGPITLTRYQRFKWVREQMAKEGISLPMPTGN